VLNRNRLLTGLVVGLILPLVIFAVLYSIFGLLENRGAASGEGLSTNFRERTLAIVAIAINVWPLQVYRRRRWEEAMRGIVVATGVMAIVWLIRFGPGLF
jgi:hypothetical protein